jgi:hypothetical protein
MNLAPTATSGAHFIWGMALLDAIFPPRLRKRPVRGTFARIRTSASARLSGDFVAGPPHLETNHRLHAGFFIYRPLSIFPPAAGVIARHPINLHMKNRVSPIAVGVPRTVDTESGRRCIDGILDRDAFHESHLGIGNDVQGDGRGVILPWCYDINVGGSTPGTLGSTTTTPQNVAGYRTSACRWPSHCK